MKWSADNKNEPRLPAPPGPDSVAREPGEFSLRGGKLSTNPAGPPVAPGSLPLPARAAAVLLSFSSIACLLLYFLGWTSLPAAVVRILLPSIGALAALLVWQSRSGRTGLTRRASARPMGGRFANLAYDLRT